ncbi:MAG: EAL domain-containing protein [Rhodocyclaceae bacterium]
MSLIRHVWVAVIASSVLAFAGSFVVSILTARSYLEQELYVKNADNANALALSLSQGGKDAVERELLIAAQFDAGHYELIRLADSNGTTITERVGATSVQNVPDWFVRFVPIRAKEGTAQVSDGWRQIGKLTLISHSGYAYRALWQGAWQLAFWFLVPGALAGLLGVAMLRRIQRPLTAVVAQANAISERRFTTIPEPSTRELRSVARAMNNMVRRLKTMFEDEAARLEGLRRQANHDPLTGLSNRDHFLNRLEQSLAGDDAAPEGLLLVLRVGDLAQINRGLGRPDTDNLLKRVAAIVEAPANLHEGAFTGRLNGADFALVVPSRVQAGSLAGALIAGVREIGSGFAPNTLSACVGVCRYRRGAAIGVLLARADSALAAAEAKGPDTWQEAPDDTKITVPQGNADWERAIREAVAHKRLKLETYPVVDGRGKVLHQEYLARLLMSEAGGWLPAAYFIPMALRLQLTAELDMAVITLAVREAEKGREVAINLSAESLDNIGFVDNLQALLSQHAEAARRIWFEVPEAGALRHYDDFCAWCDALRPTGCRIGLEHVGHHFGEIGRFHGLGIDYLKVDSSFIRGIPNHPGNQAFLKGLCGIARSIGMKVIAEGVASEWERAALFDLGFDGATGPAIVAPI